MFKGLIKTLTASAKQSGPKKEWDLATPLVSFSKKDHFAIVRACEGVLILGATGGGKSSGSGRQLALSYLRARMGGIVFCVKPDEVRVWENYCRQAGRLNDLIIFSADQLWRFNFLDFEMQRKGRGAGLIDNMVKLLRTIAEITKRDPGKSSDNDGGAFWDDLTNELLRNLISLVLLAKGKVTISDLYEVLNSAPQSMEQTKSADWQRTSLCYQCLKEAYQRPKTPLQEKEFSLIDKYWFGRFPQLAEKTRSIVVSTFSAMTDVMNRGVLSELFCGETNITPLALEEGKIIVVDLPIAEFAEVGRYSAAIWKYCTQMSLQRRDVQASPRPVFLWQDEAQHLVLATDMMFQSVCRGFRVANVVMTQNISNFYATMGNGKSSEALVDSLFGNLNTKIFHANGDHVTNEWMAKQIGRGRRLMANANSSRDPTDSISASLGIGSSRTTVGVSEQMDYLVEPSVCTTLRTGGPANNWLVDSVILSSGSCFHATGKPYLFCTFSQK